MPSSLFLGQAPTADRFRAVVAGTSPATFNRIRSVRSGRRSVFADGTGADPQTLTLRTCCTSVINRARRELPELKAEAAARHLAVQPVRGRFEIRKCGWSVIRTVNFGNCVDGAPDLGHYPCHLPHSRGRRLRSANAGRASEPARPRPRRLPATPSGRCVRVGLLCLRMELVLIRNAPLAEVAAHRVDPAFGGTGD